MLIECIIIKNKINNIKKKRKMTDMDTTDNLSEISPETSVDKKKEQLARARQSKATKKRQRDDELSEMRDMLHTIVEEKKLKKLKKEKKPEEVKEDDTKKQQIVTKVESTEEVTEKSSFADDLKGQVVKTLMVGVLGIASFCISNYRPSDGTGFRNPLQEKKKTSSSPPPPPQKKVLLSNRSVQRPHKRAVNKMGFI